MIELNDTGTLAGGAREEGDTVGFGGVTAAPKVRAVVGLKTGIVYNS
jgi:hypothetical protein